jgi:peptidyl-tRNA hydrolase
MGAEYAITRHNVGLMCLEYLVAANRSSFKPKAAYGGNIADLRFTPEFNAMALWPLTYMNIVGKPVAKAIKGERLQDSLIVLHDDLEQRLGRFRVVRGTSFK